MLKEPQIVDFKIINEDLLDNSEISNLGDHNDEMQYYYDLDFLSDENDYQLSDQKETKLKNIYSIDSNISKINEIDDNFIFDDCIDSKDENFKSNGSSQSIESICFVNSDDFNYKKNINNNDHLINNNYKDKLIENKIDDLDNKLNNSITSDIFTNISSTLKIVEEKLKSSKLIAIQGIKTFLVKKISNSLDECNYKDKSVSKQNLESNINDNHLNNYVNFSYSKNGYDSQSNESILSDESIRYPNFHINELVGNDLNN